MLSALRSLAAYLPPELLQQALALTEQIQTEYRRVEALSALVTHLSPELLPQVLELTEQIQNESDQTFVLKRLLEYLPWEKMSFSDWCDVLHKLANQRRQELLQDFPKLVPVIFHFGNQEVLNQMADVVCEVCEQWPYFPSTCLSLGYRTSVILFVICF